MGLILVKTNYNWADEADFPSFETWSQEDLDARLAEAREHFDQGKPGFQVSVGTNQEIEFNDYQDITRGMQVVPISPEEFQVLVRLFGARYSKTTRAAWGEITLARVLERV